MKCEVISIGDELLIGQTINTNASWIGEQLNNFGFSIAHGAIISDNKRVIGNCVKSYDIFLNDKYNVNSKVFIFHGANDNMIPYTESLDLSKNIRDVEVFVSYLYEHKEIADNKNPLVKFLEIIKMIKFVYSYINYNEN